MLRKSQSRAAWNGWCRQCHKIPSRSWKNCETKVKFSIFMINHDVKRGSVITAIHAFYVQRNEFFIISNVSYRNLFFPCFALTLFLFSIRKIIYFSFVWSMSMNRHSSLCIISNTNEWRRNLQNILPTGDNFLNFLVHYKNNAFRNASARVRIFLNLMTPLRFSHCYYAHTDYFFSSWKA